MSSDSAPVDDTMRFSSISMPFSRAMSEPVAMTMFLVSTTCVLPSLPDTSTLPVPRIFPLPLMTSILFFFIRNSTPLTLPSMPCCLKFIIEGRSSFGAETLTPIFAKECAGLLEHFGRMQQRLRRHAADIEAGAAERRVLLDHGDFHAELRRADRADISARTGADNNEIVSGHD